MNATIEATPGSGWAAPVESSVHRLLKDQPIRRLVVKVGSNVLTAGTERLDLEIMAGLVGQVARLRQRSLDVVVVSSGAIAAGRHRLGLAKLPRDVPLKQVFAAVGQSRLMQAWDQLFSWHGIIIAQTLLTRDDLADRQRYLNARNTLLALLELGVIPIVNENDVVAVDEIRESRIGDNDNLSAMVAGLVDADLLVMLSDTPGLFTADPRRDPSATLIPVVSHIDASIEALAGGAGSSRGTGGMITKLQAARVATSAGTAVVIAPGRERDVLVRLVDGEPLGTLFVPAATKLESRKRWMLSDLTHRGRIVVDDGAARALREQGRSLLPAGVVAVEGRFERGDIVSIDDIQGNRIGCGISNYSSTEIAIIKGCRSNRIAELLGYDYGSEVVHRNNLVTV